MEKMNKKLEKKVPVIIVMGHVDHGKTTLLDKIRGTRVQSQEAGGITQKIRTHRIETTNGVITFIDTPGHEAFTTLRSKGAKVADIVLLVVAADDGVQAQTLEAIGYAKENSLPIVVAINKIDIPGVKIEKIKQGLASADVLLEDWGGDVPSVEISAKEGKGIDDLIEILSLQSEMLELEAEYPTEKEAEIVVLESLINPKIGKEVLGIVQKGRVKPGFFIVDEKKNKVSKIRSILDGEGKRVDEAKVGEPVVICGLKDLIEIGDSVSIYDDQKQAEAYLESLERKEKEAKDEEKEEGEEEIDLEKLFASRFEVKEEDEKQVISVILKADSLGSVDAIKQEIEKLNDDDVEVRFLKTGTGEISESDVLEAKTTDSIVIGFNTAVSGRVSEFAKREKVILRNYKVIYELIDELDAVMDSLVIPEEEEVEVGKAQVKKVFVLSKGEIIAGCVVEDGSIKKGYKVYVQRNGEEIGRGTIVSLKRQKEEIKEALKGTECGIYIEPQVEVEEKDEIICYRLEKVS